VPLGGTACVSAHDLMHDPQTYPSPDTFQGARFVPTEDGAPQSKFTDVSEKFPVWGYGSLAWYVLCYRSLLPRSNTNGRLNSPGRFYASLIMKLILSEILSKYTIKLENEKARTKFYWESFTMPYESTRIILQKRNR